MKSQFHSCNLNVPGSVFMKSSCQQEISKYSIKTSGKMTRSSLCRLRLEGIGRWAQQTNELRGVEKKSGDSFSTFSASVPRPAFEILNINRREQILFTTKSHVFTYIWTIYKQHWIELNLMRLKLFQDNWEQFGNNSLTLQCSIQKLNWRLWKWLHLYGRLPKRTM